MTECFLELCVPEPIVAALALAGWLSAQSLDDSGGLIVFNARHEAEVRAIAEHDPGVVDGVLAFDAASGKSPFSAAK